MGAVLPLCQHWVCFQPDGSQSAWSRVTGGAVGPESPFWAQMEVFVELSELSGIGTFKATVPSLSRGFTKVAFPPVCFPSAAHGLSSAAL